MTPASREKLKRQGTKGQRGRYEEEESSEDDSRSSSEEPVAKKKVLVRADLLSFQLASYKLAQHCFAN